MGAMGRGDASRWGWVGMIVLATWLMPQSGVAQSGESPGGAEPGEGGGSGRARFLIRPTAEQVHIDGRLDEPAWNAAQVIPLPYESNPGDNTPAPVTTRCVATFDAEHLYLGCQAEDPEPARIRAVITDRDGIDDQDRVIFTLDPFNDGRRAFEFGVSALGVQSDAVFNQQGASEGDGGGGGRDDSWDAIWSSAGRIGEHGYTVEAAIPFRSLRFPSEAGVQSWGFFVRRQWPRSEQVETRSMHWDRDNACELCQSDLLTGLTGIAPGRNLELTPAVVAARTDTREDPPDGPLEAGNPSSELSLDAMWGVTSNLTVNVTLNPDFSQVEADAPQLEVNNRFALFFPEKRAFFLEGADFFSTPLQALFTRTIVSPSAGAKVTGKVGANALGVMLARDELPTLLFPGPTGSSGAELDASIFTGAARLRRDVGASNTVGLLLIGREGDGYYNRLMGADAVIRPLGALTARVQVLHSQTRYHPSIAVEHEQPEDAFGGDAGRLEVAYSTRSWFARGLVERLTRGFRADAGFITQVDVQRVNLWMRRTFWGDESWFTRIDLAGGYWDNETVEGALLDRGLWMSASVRGPGQSHLWINPNYSQERYEGVRYEFSSLWFGGEIQPSGALAFEFFGSVGPAIDYDNGRLADQVQLSPQIRLRVGRRVDLGVNHAWRRLSSEGETVFDANVSQLRAVYNFSPRMFVRAIVQHRSTRRDPSLYREEVDRFRRSVASQLLFSYKLNPQSVVFVGYGDARVEWTDVGFRSVPLIQIDRTLFAKASYAWRP